MNVEVEMSGKVCWSPIAKPIWKIFPTIQEAGKASKVFENKRKPRENHILTKHVRMLARTSQGLRLRGALGTLGFALAVLG